MKIFTVCVDALGTGTIFARKGETLTEEQIGVENADRLLKEGFITEYFASQVTGSIPPVIEAPSGARALLELGLPIESETLTEEEIAWVKELQAGIKSFELSGEVKNLTTSEIKKRIEGVGGVPKKGGNKTEAIESLEDVTLNFICSLKFKDEDESDFSDGDPAPDKEEDDDGA